ncbi:hypothetical protein [Streptomyces virginiae]|uniref:hypothetical protein n=1 Tax=Streptomyces virginiae TaxID=1961 RepID=UPI002DD842CF|nr:hypothetical protein [Streptomyces virginiae]WSC81380.1 hypothetical protein OHA56_36465 [Streptomyces virginiae]
MPGGFDQEWGQLRADAADRRVDMRLNGTGAPAGPTAPGGSATFASTPAEKSATADTIQNELEPRTRTATEHADEATNTAVKGFEGWDTAPGLKKVAETWDGQVKALMGRLGAEKVQLRGTFGLVVRNDIGLTGSDRSAGRASTGFRGSRC